MCMVLNSKKVSFISFFLVFLLLNCNQSQPKVQSNDQQLVEKFKSIIKQENFDFYKKDFNSWSKHFEHSNAIYWVCVEDNVTLRANGWDDLSQFVSSWMKENPKPETDTVLNRDSISDFHIEQSGKIAFIKYTNHHMLTDGKTKTFLENRTFKFNNGEWKILAMVSSPAYNTPKSSKNIFTHNDLTK